jgi:predicted phage terminase large subunit-like protein
MGAFLFLCYTSEMKKTEEVFNIYDEITRQHLGVFIRRAFPIINPNTEYSHNWHIDAISEYLMAAYQRDIKRLIINIPPRSLKSTCATIALPAWGLGNNPSLQFMCGSYSRAVSNKHSQDTRHLMLSPFYKEIFPDLMLAKDQNEKGKFMTTARGQRMSVSVGSAATGEGGDFLILDDPVNPQQAASDVERETANEWFRQTFSSRLNDKRTGVIIVVMQRLHENDVTGMLLESGGWEHLCLPAINDKKRIFCLGYKDKQPIEYEWGVGDLLDKDRLALEMLDQAKHEMGTAAFTGQYLQRPAPEGGGIFKEKWWKLWKGSNLPNIEFTVQIYDTAYGIKQTNDYSARTTWGIFTDDNGKENIILLESMNQRLEFPDLREEAKRSYRDVNPDLVLIEPKASGESLIQEFKRAGLRVRAIERHSRSGDKLQRANIATIIFEQGRVWVPATSTYVEDEKVWEPEDWAQKVIDQCSVFPYGSHDDLVDTVIDGTSFLRQYKSIRVDSDREDEPRIEDRSKNKRFYG